MENIELRWIERRVVKLADQYIVDKKMVLQYRKYMDTGAYAGMYKPPAVNMQWSEWTDVPTVTE